MEPKDASLRNRKFTIHTFGCQMNKNDSERLAGWLVESGAQKADSLEESDIIIVNTCAVRAKSEEKFFSYLGRLSSLKKKKERLIGVVGCIAQLYRSELLDKKPYVDFILGPDNYHRLPRILSRRIGEKLIATNWTRQWHEASPRLIRESPVSASVTIMEGCNNFCTYCVVPFTRGREKFRPLRNVLMEIQGLANDGYKEIQLLGQNVNSYRDPESGKSFSALLNEASRFEGIHWIRFITSHPQNFTADIARTMNDSEKVCRQLHLPLQSGSSSLLQRMNRKYSKEEYLEKISLVRRLMPDIRLSTDIIVGFSGETEKDFLETLQVLEDVRFANIFSFRYSPRPYTKAARMEDDVPQEEKRRRLMEVQRLQKQIQMENHKALVGKDMKVLVVGKSKKDPATYSGRNEGYQVVNFTAPNNFIGQFVRVRISSCGPYSLRGEFLDSL
ncbi:MAG: tRNA (N6-isopentenyl adenosine(37)-C2)-methylthiotransferase MiaB [Candidatus Aminicenantales bacterium]